MRRLLGLMAAVVAILILAPTNHALGGVVVVGVGEGTAIAANGSYYCEGVTFTVQAIYLPGNVGVLHLYWEGNLDCLHDGGSLAVGTVSVEPSDVPPFRFNPQCTGSESAGLDCGFLAIGPYGGPGSTVWARKSADVESFFGSFVAF